MPISGHNNPAGFGGAGMVGSSEYENQRGCSPICACSTSMQSLQHSNGYNV